MSVSLFPLSHSLSLTHTLYLSHTLSIPLSHSLYPSLTSLFLSHPPTLALAAHLCVCLYHSLTYSHTHSHTHTHTHTHTRTHTQGTDIDGAGELKPLAIVVEDAITANGQVAAQLHACLRHR